ncbi:uncharacterized protein LOC111134338 [Crassostrea virginica]
MAVSEKLAASIDTFSDSSRGSRFCFVLTLSAWFIHTLSYSTNGWAEISEGALEASQGLWNHCSRSAISTDFTCCETVGNFFQSKNQGIPAWLHAVRFFQSVGLLTSLASLVFSVLCTFVSKTVKNRGVQIAAAVLNFLAAGSMLVGVSIYGGQYRYETWIKSYYPSWSFAFSIIAGVCYLISGFVHVFTDSASIQPQQNEQPQSNQSDNQRPEPSAPPLPPYYIPPPEGQHPQYPPSSGQAHPSTAADGNSEPNTCCVCLDHPPEIMFMPCRHMKTCEQCANPMTTCPICRGTILEKIRPFQ